MTTRRPVEARGEPVTIDAQPERQSTVDATAGHLRPIAVPELHFEYRVRIYFRSAEAEHATRVLTEQEARDLTARLDGVAWQVERRAVGNWHPLSNPQRNRQVTDEVAADDLHPEAPPPYRPRARRPFHGPRNNDARHNADPDGTTRATTSNEGD